MPTLNEMIDFAKIAGICSLDNEWSPETIYHEEGFDLHGMGFSTTTPEGEVVAEYYTERQDIQKVLDELTEAGVGIVGHYFHNDIMAFWGAGYKFNHGDPLVLDTSIAYNLLFEELKENELGLKKLVPKFLGYTIPTFEECSDDMDSQVFIDYAKRDVITQLELYLKAKPELEKEDLHGVFKILCQSTVAFADVMFQGFHFDIDAAEEVFNKLCIIRDELEELITKQIGTVNLNSPKQLAQRLFNELGYTHPHLDVSKKTGLVSTGVDNLTKLAAKYPACEAIMAYKTCTKMISTYIEPLVELTSAYGPRIHTTFWLVSATGRTRSSGPNIQNVPGNIGKSIKLNEELKAAMSAIKLRSLYAAPEGSKLVVCDFSSLEYRTAAVAAPEPTLIDMYKYWKCEECGHEGSSSKVVECCTECQGKVKQGKDLHQFNCDLANEMGAGINRQAAKGVSFCVIFGGGAYRLGQMLKLPTKKCEQIISGILDKLPGFKTWHERSARLVKGNGIVREMFGRRRKVDIKQAMRERPQDAGWIQKNATNQLVNFVAQAPACIIAQLATQNVRKRLIKEGLWGDQIRIVNFVHDEIVLEAKEEYAEYAFELLKHEMQTAVDIGVPLPVEGSIVDSWDQAK